MIKAWWPFERFGPAVMVAEGPPVNFPHEDVKVAQNEREKAFGT